MREDKCFKQPTRTTKLGYIYKKIVDIAKNMTHPLAREEVVTFREGKKKADCYGK